VRVRLICWDTALEAERRRAIETLGLEVDTIPVEPSKLITHIRLTQPDAVVIDLSKLPSHGRAVGITLRTTKATRSIPLVFLGGDPFKVERVRKDLPDAAFGSWDRLKVSLFSKKREGPLVVPLPHMQQFGASSLEKKLGLGNIPRVTVIGAPEGFVEKIAIPVDERVTSKTLLAIWFIRSRLQLEREMEFMALYPPLWIAFPKQTGRSKSDFTQHDVRRIAGEAGLVDNKVCAIDDDWSAIRFARRK